VDSKAAKTQTRAEKALEKALMMSMFNVNEV